MLRSLFALIALLTGLGTDAFAAATLSEAIPIPGGTVALARAIGLETPPEPSRFLAEVARLTYDVPEGRKERNVSTLRRLTAHLDAAARFRVALEALPNGSLTLGLATREQEGRDQLKTFLELVNLRLKESRGTYSVETGDDDEAAARVQLLSALGVELEHLESRLNQGESIQLKLPTELAPVPLTTALWSEAVFHRTVQAQDLFAAIFSASGTAHLAHGLAALDDETLAYVAAHPALLDQLSGDGAAAFAAFASNVHIHEGRVVTPGGSVAVPLWESVIDEKIDSPESFMTALLSRDNGHLAYLYDLIAELDVPRGAFALGLWIDDARVRIDRFKSLVSTVHSTLAEWQVRETPFTRPLDDIGWMLLNVPVEPNGAPQGPVALELWSRVFESLDLPNEAAARKAFAQAEKGGVVDAAWLADAILTRDTHERGDRMQQLAFGLRVFRAARRDAFGDVLTAVRAVPVFTTLMLTLERMGIAEARVHAVAARTAERLSNLEGGAAFIALSQFQGAMVLLSRMSAAGSLEPVRAASLVLSLSTIPLDNGHYGAGVPQWLRTELLPVMVSRKSPEETLLAGLAGVTAAPRGGTERVSWEGEQYRLDLPAAEERRLRAVRQKQGAYSVDIALTLEQVAGALRAEAIDLAGIQSAIATLRALRPALHGSDGATARNPDGVGNLPDAVVVVDRSVKDLSTITKPNDAKKAKRLAEPLSNLSGVILGEALTSIAYALNISDAAEGLTLGGDLSRRHDFGLALKGQAARTREAWAIPRQLILPGTPRRVSGSLLALDIAFARALLRRVVLEEDAGSTPSLLSNDRDTFTKSVALLDPYSMRDAERDAIAAALSRGRARIEAVAAGSGEHDTLDVIAREVKQDGWRRRAAHWDLEHEPRRLVSLFSLTEMLVLGAGQTERLAGWGMAGIPVSGCLCTRFAAPNEWRIIGGRPQIGSLSASIPDLNLHVAEMLSMLRLPAPLARMIIGAAMQEFVDRVRPNDANDWLTLVRGASLVSRERIEDYAAAATVDGPLLNEKSYQERQP